MLGRLFSSIQGKLICLHLVLIIGVLALVAYLATVDAAHRQSILIAGLAAATLQLGTLLITLRVVQPLRARATAANQELEEQRELVAQAARLAAMGEMAAGIAHEINNPLTTIKNLLHTLRGQLSSAETGRKDLQIIEEEIDKITNLVRNFMRYARPPKARIAETDLRELFEKHLELLEPQIHQKELKVARDFEADAPLALADPEQIGQVMLNLLLNAIQASPQGAAILVFIRAGAVSGRRRVEFGVGDSGAGIAAADREQIFRPFFTTKAQGTGLGLAISQRIVEEHGGEITTEARGEGATFVVTLNVGQEARG
jgi:signal transduction histidine kinase